MSEKNVLSGTLGVEATKSFKINLHLLVRWSSKSSMTKQRWCRLKPNLSSRHVKRADR